MRSPNGTQPDRRVRVLTTQEAIVADHLDGCAVVVIDVLLATTTLIAILENGARRGRLAGRAPSPAARPGTATRPRHGARGPPPPASQPRLPAGPGAAGHLRRPRRPRRAVPRDGVPVRCRRGLRVPARRRSDARAVPRDRRGGDHHPGRSSPRRLASRGAGRDRPAGFLERQVDGWIARFRNARTDDVPHAEVLIRSLRENIPESPGPAVIHNDFKLNNLLYDPISLDLTAVLDWEMATIGDPLFDLAIFLAYWGDSRDDPALRPILPSVTERTGFHSRGELISLYEMRLGEPVFGLDWYLTFAYFRLAAILQQIYARWIRGQTRDERFADFGRRVRVLLEHARRRAIDPLPDGARAK